MCKLAASTFNYRRIWYKMLSKVPFVFFEDRPGTSSETQLSWLNRSLVEFAGKLLRIRRSWKQRDRRWPPFAQSETSIPLSCETGSVRAASQELSHPFLKTFAAAYRDPWVSERGPRTANNLFKCAVRLQGWCSAFNEKCAVDFSYRLQIRVHD